jgi:hypothetical protein
MWTCPITELLRPAIRGCCSGERVLVCAHGNSLRALVKYLDGIPDEDISGLEISTGNPLVYELDKKLKPLRHYYLGPSKKKKLRRTIEVICSVTLNPALDNDKWLVLHFGMTGFLKYFKKKEKDSPHDRLLISFTNGYHLAYDCQRKLGEVYLIGDLMEFIKEKALGPDAWVRIWILHSLVRPLESRELHAVKSTLMNQKIIAGIGNIYFDEILFQAGIHPKTKAGQVDKQSLQTLFKEINNVLSTAKERQADPEKIPAT